MKPDKSTKRARAKDKSTKSAPASNVDAYLATLPKDMQVALQGLREAIKAAAPTAEEVISYQIPTYKYHGPLVHFVARKSYCSLIVVSRSILETFNSELEGYETSGTTIHFSPEKPLPTELVKKIVKARMKENETRQQ
jgi:uncharacterized protein YdhG (YjbR/CyaY superfamily)